MDASNSTIDIASPPWPLIHFDVFCARCGHDLRGQSEPVCPACHLEFSWSQAAPLDQLTCAKCSYHLYGLSDSRCPECGTPIDWNEALLRYRRREKPLFEYRWRDRPIRSFFRTWLLALRPRRLWQAIEIHDSPQFRPLLFWTLTLFLGAGVCIPLGMASGSLVSQTLNFLVAGPSNWSWSIVWALVSTFGRTFILCTTRPSIFISLLFLACWWIFSFLALLVFRQSMRLFKVRTIHVFRIAVYALTAAIPLFAFWFIFVGAFFRFSFNRRPSWLNAMPVLNVLFEPYGWVVLGFMCFTTWAIRQGYRKYARMPHSIGVAIASQIIALLATISIPQAIMVFLRGGW